MEDRRLQHDFLALVTEVYEDLWGKLGTFCKSRGDTLHPAKVVKVPVHHCAKRSFRPRPLNQRC